VSLIRRHPSAAAPEPISNGAARATSAGVRESGGHSLRQLPVRKEARRRAFGTAVSGSIASHIYPSSSTVSRRRHGNAGDDRHGSSEPSYPAISRRPSPMLMGSPDDLFKTARYRGSVSSSAGARLLWQGSDKFIQPCDRTRRMGKPLRNPARSWSLPSSDRAISWSLSTASMLQLR
jgi:hypothetical protein